MPFILSLLSILALFFLSALNTNIFTIGLTVILMLPLVLRSIIKEPISFSEAAIMGLVLAGGVFAASQSGSPFTSYSILAGFMLWQIFAIGSKKYKSYFEWGVIGIGVMQAAIGAYQWALGGHLRAYGTFQDTNLFGAICYVGVLLLVNKKMTLTYKVPALILMVSAGLMSGSRGALLCFLLTCLIFIPWSSLKNYRVSKKTAGALMLVVILGVLGFKTVGTRIADNNSLSIRQELISKSLEMVRNSDKVAGLGNWRREYSKLRSIKDVESAGYYAHNDYVQGYVEGGVPFLMSLIIPILIGLRSPSKNVATFIGLFSAVNFCLYSPYIQAILGILWVSMPPKFERSATVSIYFRTLKIISCIGLVILTTILTCEALTFKYLKEKTSFSERDINSLLLVDKLALGNPRPSFELAQLYASKADAAWPHPNTDDLDNALFYYTKAISKDSVDTTLKTTKAVFLLRFAPPFDIVWAESQADALLDSALKTNPTNMDAIEAKAWRIKKQKGKLAAESFLIHSSVNLITQLDKDRVDKVLGAIKSSKK